ncbi:MAG: energy-coupling factor transporter transmembrane component T [Tissierellales bacterium]
MISLDPRTKIITVLIISSAAIILKELMYLFFLLLLTLFICKLLSISLFGAIKKLRKLWIFFLVLALIQSVFNPGGEAIIGIRGINVLTTNGLISGTSIILRMSIIIFSALIIASSPVLETVYGLIAMRLPYEIAFMVLLAIKFLPLFKEEFTDSIIAVQLAGEDLKRIPLGQKLSLYTYILTPSVIKALGKAKYISISMECRGFRSYPNRTSYCRLKMKKLDYLVILLVSLLSFAIIAFHFSIIG